ncbi:MAG: SUMF1/EgtB/PvdO family nonheme iron enzyme [Gemmatimonadetes bacterium]|nr:SUMF1/EgtB/PvdO family nonheme iron enzyme [Gemmatimonadota bacterium]
MTALPLRRFVAVSALLLAPCLRGQEVVRDSIPGTLVTIELVRVPAGPVTLGGSRRDVAGFLLGRTELSWDAYDAFTMSRAPSPRYSPAGADAVAGPSRPYGNPDYGFGHAGFPVISVTRDAALAFCAWLSTVTGHRYRLPTEAEWQRAADLAGRERAVGTRQAADSTATRAPGAGTRPVASGALTAPGLYHLFGNVAEWVIPDDGALVVRGGSWQDPPAAVGPLARARQAESWNERDPQIPKSSWWLSDGPFVGFRIVREP